MASGKAPRDLERPFSGASEPRSDPQQARRVRSITRPEGQITVQKIGPNGPEPYEMPTFF